MTLVQVLADRRSVHMSCDFRLTDAVTGRLVGDDAHKLVTVGMGAVALVGVTGLAVLGGLPVATWLTRTLFEIPPTAGPGAVAERIREQAQPLLARVSSALHRRTTFVIGGHVGIQSRVYLVSNFETITTAGVDRRDEASLTLSVTSMEPTKAVYLSTGVGGLVSKAQQQEAVRLLRAGAPDTSVQRKLADLNANVSQLSSAVSVGCYTASLHATGQGSARPFLTDAQPIDFSPPDTMTEMLRSLGVSVPVLGGREVGRTFVRNGVGEPYFKAQLRLRPQDAALWNNYGADLVERGRHAEAVRAFVRASELDPRDVLSRRNLAHLRIRSGDIEDAARLYVEALNLGGENVPTWLLADYGEFAAFYLKDEELADAYFQRACQDRNYPLSKAMYGLHLLRAGKDLDEGATLLEESLAGDATNFEILRTVGYAEVRFLGRIDAGRTHLEQAVIQAPRDVLTLEGVAHACLLSGDYHSTAYYCGRAVRFGSDAWDVQLWWGVALLLDGKPLGALRHLARCRRYAPPDMAVVVDMNIAATHWAQRQRAQAVSELRALRSAAMAKADWELEILAMLAAAGEEGSPEPRFHQLLAEGTTSDALTLRGMKTGSDNNERARIERLAQLIRGESDRGAGA